LPDTTLPLALKDLKAHPEGKHHDPEERKEKKKDQ